MNLRDHLKSIPRHLRPVFADRCGTSAGFLANVACGYRGCGPALAVRIEAETSGAVRRWDLRPTDWHEIWPELVGAEGAPTAPCGPRSQEVARVPACKAMS